jgi:probable HAF family extracellular repeat protein
MGELKMSLNSWLQNLRSALAPDWGRHHHGRRGSLRARAHRLNVEVLEDRCVPAQYAVTDLGYLYPTDLNNAGQVVGNSTLATDSGYASIVANGTQISLGSLGGNFSHAAAINDLGQVVGTSAVAGNASHHAFLLTPQGGVWFRDSDLDGRNDLMIDLVEGEATAINNAGQVVGTFGGGAFLWDAVNGMTTLGNGIPTGINDYGQVIGEGGWGSPFLWDAVNGMTFLDTGGFPTFVKAINNAGQIAGDMWYAANPGENAVPWAVEWYGSGFWNLYGDSSTLSSNANDINNSGFYGQVVGSVETDIGGIDVVYGSLATVWNEGRPQYLQYSLLPDSLPPGSNVTLYSAEAINDRGAIVADGTINGSHTAYLLTPVPPGTPTVNIAGALAVTEGNAGTRAATFTVTLSAASSQTVTVAYATGDSSAVAGSDYQATSGTLTFAPGETSKIVTVLVNGDRIPEPNETFVVNLSGATNAVIAGGQGMGTIVDDEPRIRISDVTKKEGKRNQTTLFTFTVTLSAAYDQAVTMSFQTVNGTAKTSDSDYIAKTGTLTFAPGETTKTITIEVKGDSKKEANETFYLDLFGNSSNSLFTKNRGIGTILNDD